MAKSPFKDSTRKSKRVSANEGLDLAVVEQADDDQSHTVLIRILTAQSGGSPTVAAATVAQLGDVSIPQPGALVVVGRVKGRRPIVLGTLYTSDNPVGAYSAGSRVIGNDSGGTITITEDGQLEVSPAPGESVLLSGRRAEETISNPLSLPHTEWGGGNTENEIWRVELQDDEVLKAYRLEVKFKGGGTHPDFYIDLYDVDDGVVIASTSDVAQGGPIGESGKGHTVIARITNDTGTNQIASISSKISIERDR